MELEQTKKIIRTVLLAMGSTDPTFTEGNNGSTITVTFNSREVTSFTTHIEGWTYSGIHLDPTGKRQYKIDFVKN